MKYLKSPILWVSVFVLLMALLPPLGGPSQANAQAAGGTPTPVAQSPLAAAQPAVSPEPPTATPAPCENMICTLQHAYFAFMQKSGLDQGPIFPPGTPTATPIPNFYRVVGTSYYEVGDCESAVPLNCQRNVTFQGVTCDHNYEVEFSVGPNNLHQPSDAILVEHIISPTMGFVGQISVPLYNVFGSTAKVATNYRLTAWCPQSTAGNP